MRITIKKVSNVKGKYPPYYCGQKSLYGHCTIYFEKKSYIFNESKLYIHDLKTKKFINITMYKNKVKGKLMSFYGGTSTLVNNKVINTCNVGT